MAKSFAFGCYPVAMSVAGQDIFDNESLKTNMENIKRGFNNAESYSFQINEFEIIPTSSCTLRYQNGNMNIPITLLENRSFSISSGQKGIQKEVYKGIMRGDKLSIDEDGIQFVCYFNIG